MRNLWKVGALSAVFGAVLGMGGCSDFEAAYEGCQDAGRCGPQANGDGGTDGGEDAGYDCEPVPNSGPDLPDDEGRDTDCDGVDGVADAGYFVDSLTGSDTADGSQEHPFSTLGRALEAIQTAPSGRTTIYLARGTYSADTTEVVGLPVSIHGGYSRRGTSKAWDRYVDGGTLIAGGTVAFTVRDVTSDRVLLDGLHIASSDALQFSGASIGLRVIHTTDLQLHNTVVEAGRGGPGEAGAVGNGGAAGAPGTDGGSAKGSTAGDQGPGGVPSCSVNGSGVGGTGANGVGRDFGDTGGTGEPDTAGGLGGGDGGPVLSNGVYTCTGGQGADGGIGNPGMDGLLGDAGTGMGLLNPDAGLWEPQALQRGASGTPGRIGAGGGGGGSGGACSDRSVNASENAASGGGGGGGSGGCGGEPGTGGGAGGASIAMVLIDSHATVGVNSRLTTRGGGPGGRGGDGGVGGPGGEGALGGIGADVSVISKLPTRYTTYGGNGGNGGRGGKGGQGGAGGGGAGGPSIGIWCAQDARVTLEDGGMVDPVGGGTGGEGPGHPGDKGVQSPSVGCTFVDAGTP
ncbi:hypothetical protein [Corallococcus sp. 4LFB]|uniref:hypothetical protein n=1 Tax=Corallococcus sp. 4LFB TaxID=3383249 RepID=UPI003976D25B